MPNRYEREIEEILRNLERTEPKPRLGERFRRRSDRRMNVHRPGLPSLRFSMSEWLLIIAGVSALVAGGYAYAQGEPGIFTGIVAIVGTVCMVWLVLAQFILRPRSSTQSTRYGNVTPLRRNPLNSLRTRWNLFLLKLRYRRRREH